jgi:hypothetical protein
MKLQGNRLAGSANDGVVINHSDGDPSSIMLALVPNSRVNVGAAGEDKSAASRGERNTW